MTVEEFQYISKQVSEYTNTICLHVMGEPLMHPNLASIMDQAYKVGLKINLVTNGVLISSKLQELNHPALNKISISVHSYEANNNGIEFLDYLTPLLDLPNHTHAYVEYRLWNMESDTNKLNDRILKLFCQHFDVPMFDKNTKLADKVYFVFDKKFKWRDTQKEKKFCHALSDHIAILCDGKVAPCCMDNDGEIALGNIFKNSLSSIINSPLANSMLCKLRQSKAPTPRCKICGFADKYTK